MKPLSLEMSPTRSRRLNEILGLGVVTLAVLLLLALVSYAPTDPSLNTVGGYAGAGVLRPVHNWIGKTGAFSSDLLLQVLGIAVFLFPFLLARLGVSWMRSQRLGSPTAKGVGLLLWLISAPTLLGLLPWHLRWRGALPVEGVAGRLLADAAVVQLNYPGACVVSSLLLLLSIYLSTSFTFNTAQDWAGQRLGIVYRARERYIQWRGGRANLQAARVANRLETRRERAAARQSVLEATAAATAERNAHGTLLGGLFAKWGFWRRGIRADQASADNAAEPKRTVWSRMPRTDVDAGPEPEFAPLPSHLQAEAAAQLERNDLLNEDAAPAPFAMEQAEEAPLYPGRREADFSWLTPAAAAQPQAMPRTAEIVPFPAAPSAPFSSAPLPPPMTEREEPVEVLPPALVAAVVQPAAAAAQPAPAGGIAFGKRADESVAPVTLTAKSVHGYKLPPSSLLYRNEEHAAVREEELRDEARILVEKCGEFGVDGQVTQINPGPAATGPTLPQTPKT